MRIAAIWPETASPFLLAQDREARRLAAETLPPGALLLAGTVRAEWGEDNRLREVWNSLVVLDAGGERIPGLYAAGRTSAGMPNAPYIASGVSIGDCSFFGRQAGIHAAKEEVAA
jgi:hypothetical protein